MERFPTLTSELPASPEAMQFLERVEATGFLKSPAGKIVGRQFNLLPEALVSSAIYSFAERQCVVNQLRVALTDFYVHLERKKAVYGFDPVRALDLLGQKIAQMSDGEFHEAIVALIARTRDRHLSFVGRTPYGVSAVLPFTIESCWEGDDQLFLVTKIDSGFHPKSLRTGARVSHWNGIPIKRFVRLNANVFDGGNEAASLARSLAFLTHRQLNRFGPPLEEWVDLRFSMEGTVSEERFTWSGLDTTQTPSIPALGRGFSGFGGDLQLFDLQLARRARFAPASFDAPPSNGPSQPASGVPVIEGSGAGGVFDYGSVTTPEGTFAYVRLWSFRAETADDLVDALIAVIPKLAKTGIILDIRGNSGGYIAAGERMLQLFTSRPIVPARFQFRVTPATRAMAEASDEFAAWRPSLAEAFQTGEIYTQGFPIEGTDSDANKVGQQYFGPVVLIADALAFSTADIFAAGFIDNDIGRVICTDGNMAAAGGNNWTPWDVVRLYNPDFHLDSTIKADLEAGKLSAEIFDGFNQAGVSLSQKATLSSRRDEYDGSAWTIVDGTIEHIVRSLPWMTSPVCVYLQQSRLGLTDMPAGVILSVTMRRSLRVKGNEGRILEDVGIVPDIVYHMTTRDVMEHNQDLFAKACLELSQGAVKIAVSVSKDDSEAVAAYLREAGGEISVVTDQGFDGAQAVDLLITLTPMLIGVVVGLYAKRLSANRYTSLKYKGIEVKGVSEKTLLKLYERERQAKTPKKPRK